MAMQSPLKRPHWKPGSDGKFENGTWYCKFALENFSFYLSLHVLYHRLIEITGSCVPPKPGVRYQVKKEGPNLGKWFYRCQNPRETQCNFFLFEEDAKEREKSALFYADGNSNATTRSQTATTNSNVGANAHLNTPVSAQAARSETPQSDRASTIGGSDPLFSPRSSVFPTPGPAKQHMFRGIPRSPDEMATWDDSDGESFVTAGDAATRTAERIGRHHAPSNQLFPTPTKRKLFAAVGDEFHDDGLDGDDVMEMVDTIVSQTPTKSSSQFTQASSQFSNNGPPSTPTKAGGTTSAAASFTTPNSRPAQPQFAGAAFTEPGPKRIRTVQGAATATTPSPARTRNALGSNSSQPSPSQSPTSRRIAEDADVTVAIMGLLKSEPIQDSVRRAVYDTLKSFAERAKGVERGRDFTRVAFKEKELRVKELEAKVAKLEDQRVARKERLKKMVGELQGLLQQMEEDEGE